MAVRGQHKPAEARELPDKYQRYFSARGEDQRCKNATVESMPKRQFQVNEIRDQHHEIIRRLILGQNAEFIARQIGVSGATVRNVKNSPVVQERLDILNAKRDQQTLDVAAHIDRIAPKSIQLLEDIITGTGDGVDAPISLRARTAENNLDRAGYGAVKKFQGAVGHFTGEDIEKLKQEALQRMNPVNQTG